MGIYIPGLKGNATVPGSAPIQPPQAFVDAFLSVLSNGAIGSATFIAPNCNIETISPVDIFGAVSNDGFNCDLSGNKLTVESVNVILSFLAGTGTSNGTLDLSGGTDATPTQQDANQTVAAGDSSFRAGAYRKNGTHNAKPYYNAAVDFDNPIVSSVSWSGTQWECYDTNGDLVYLSLDVVAFPWLATFISVPVIGVDPVPVFAGPVNADVLVLTAAGWTVTTN